MKNWKKRMFGLFCCMLMVFGWGASAAAEPVTIDNFSMLQYRADEYVSEDTPSYKNIQYLMERDMPSQAIVELLDNKPVFQNSVKAWKGIHIATSPSQLAEGMLDEKGYYEAIIFSVFLARQDEGNYVFDTCKKITSETNKVISVMESWVKASDNIALNGTVKTQKISEMSTTARTEVKEFLVEEYSKNHPDLNAISAITDTVNTVFDMAETLADAVMTLSCYMQLAELSEGTKAVINGMYNQCPTSNSLLKEALKEAATATDNYEMALVATTYNVTIDELEDVVGTVIDEGWSNAIKEVPYVNAFMAGAKIGDKIGTAISNTLFSTDKTIEQYEKMKCLGEFNDVLRAVVKNMGDTYSNSRTDENAANYIEAVSALYSAEALSCDFAANYADILYSDTAIGWMTISSVDYQEYMRLTASIKSMSQQSEEELEINCRYQLEADYPEIYAVLYGGGAAQDEKVPVTGISFAQDEITIGLEDAECHIEKPIVSPQNATDQAIVYKSSDESILSMWLTYSNICEPHKTGTVTVTAESADGGYVDSIVVHVVEGSTDQFAGVELPGIVNSGTCGENLDWVLFDNGLLSITGTGEMENKRNYESIPWYYYNKYYNGEKIKQIKIGEGVTSIGDYAFWGCSSLTNIELPSGITSIGNYVIYGCSSLKSIELPPEVTSIGWYAFVFCGSEDFVIYGYADSYAESYAEACGITFKVIGEEDNPEDSGTAGDNGGSGGDTGNTGNPGNNQSGGNNTVNGLAQGADGNWYYYVNGAVDTSYTSLANNESGWWYVENGMINFGYNGLIYYNDAWWCVAGGQVRFDYTGLWNDPNVGWWYVENGMINFGYNGLIYYNDAWWCVAGGQVRFDYTGLWNDPNVGWWYVENGMINFGYNGLIYYNDAWWCVAGGQVCFDYTGLWNDPNVGWWYVENGMINFGCNGLIYYNDAWWCVAGGQVRFDYTGLWYDANVGWWYVSGGAVDFGYTGTCIYNGGTYNVVNGAVAAA